MVTNYFCTKIRLANAVAIMLYLKIRLYANVLMFNLTILKEQWYHALCVCLVVFCLSKVHLNLRKDMYILICVWKMH